MAQNIIERWKPRFGETDKDTRGPGRLPVNVLPSRLAIINVYELFRKKKIGGSADKKQKAQQKGQGRAGGRPKGLSFARYGEPRIKAGIIDGIEYDTEGFPMEFEGETRHDYNSRASKFIRKYPSTSLSGITGKKPVEEKPVKSKKPKPDKTELKKSQEKEAEENEEIRKFRQDKKDKEDEYERKIKEEHKKDPLWMLWDKVKYYQIRATPNEGTIPPNKYIRKDTSNDVDLEEIKEAFKKAIANKMIPQRPGQPPAIIPVQASMYNPPKVYYISNELNKLRRKKFMHSKAKRPVKHMAKKSYGNKRKVVLKKKGGR